MAALVSVASSLKNEYLYDSKKSAPSNASQMATLGGRLASAAAVVLAIIALVNAGAIPQATIGWVAVGLAAGGFLLKAIGAKLRKEEVSKLEIAINFLMAAGIATFGTLGALNYLPLHQMAYGIIASFAAGTVLGCGHSLYKHKSKSGFSPIGSTTG